MIYRRIKEMATEGLVIPKPMANAEFTIKGIGLRGGEEAITYLVPNHKHPSRPITKGITRSEWERAHERLEATGSITRRWFDEVLDRCSVEGPCNFTTIGGIFELLGIARYGGNGVYLRVDSKDSH
jgi:hypothetical protein